jgi:hypothetical protein
MSLDDWTDPPRTENLWPAVPVLCTVMVCITALVIAFGS